VDGEYGIDDPSCGTDTDPCKTINHAIGRASTGDSVLIAGGTYTENVIVNKELSLLGGYEAIGWTRDLNLSPTIIDADDSGRPILVSDNTENVVLDGLVIVGGNTAEDGGGIYITGGDVQILNSVIGENSTTACCGGIHIGNSAKVGIRDTEISFNISESSGGGLGIFSGSVVTITNSYINYNTSKENSGAVDVRNAQANVMNTYLQYNDARMHGGAISTFASTISLTNTLLTNNKTISDTANVLAINSSSISILNSTITGNNPTGDQAIILWSGTPTMPHSVLTMTNSIMWDNALSLQANPPCVDCFVVNYSDVQGIDGLPGIAEDIGNFDADPLFYDSYEGDYHLLGNSPCINTGDPNTQIPYDIEGSPRTPPPDVGAYEWIGVKIFLPIVVKY